MSQAPHSYVFLLYPDNNDSTFIAVREVGGADEKEHKSGTKDEVELLASLHEQNEKFGTNLIVNEQSRKTRDVFLPTIAIRVSFGALDTLGERKESWRSSQCYAANLVILWYSYVAAGTVCASPCSSHSSSAPRRGQK